jgi:bacteriocin-like protein
MRTLSNEELSTISGGHEVFPILILGNTVAFAGAGLLISMVFELSKFNTAIVTGMFGVIGFGVIVSAVSD